MPNEEQVALLKKSVQEWNEWRKENPSVKIDLSEADLRGADLSYAHLFEADLSGAHLFDANLSDADLFEANLNGAILSDAYLWGADLREADLNGAHLSYAHFIGAGLDGAEFAKAIVEYTIFAYVDLSNVEGLDDMEHRGPSTVGIDTIYQSGGEYPGGVPTWRRCGRNLHHLRPLTGRPRH